MANILQRRKLEIFADELGNWAVLENYQKLYPVSQQRALLGAISCTIRGQVSLHCCIILVYCPTLPYPRYGDDQTNEFLITMHENND